VHTAIIVNRHAGSMRRNPALADRMRRLCGRNAALFVTRDAGELARVAEQLAGSGATTVGVLGGDGTASATLTALWRAYDRRPLPNIAFLRGGTMNTVATSIGISQHSPYELLRRTLRAAAHPERARLRVRPAIRIGERLGFLFGTGVWYGYIAESYAGGPPTRMTNATVLGRALASAAVNGSTYARIFEPHQLSVRFAEGAWEPRAYLTIAAGTIADAGFGFRPFHRAFQTDAAFQLLAIKGSALDVLRELPGVWFGRGLGGKTAYDTVTSWAELRAAEGSFGYSVDGDVATAQGTLRLELGPSFSFLRI
jgi:diacylglycerol kinase family enzyme